MKRRLLLQLALTGALAATGRGRRLIAAEAAEEAAAETAGAEGATAPANAWPMFRGCLAGTGRSAATLALPLRQRWQRTLEKTAFEATPIISEGTIYLGDLDGTFHALALESGETRWSFKGDAPFTSAAVVSTAPGQQLVVVGDVAGMVRAFDRTSGAVVWTYETTGEISGGPTLLERPEGLCVLVGSQDASLSALNFSDGTLLWKHSIADQIRCSPTVARGKVLLAGCDGKLHILNAASGESVAAVAIDGPTGTTPAAWGSKVCFGSEGGVFWGIDVETAQVAWQVAPAAAGKAYRSSAAIGGDLAIVGSRGRAVEAFQLSDGARKWRQPMRGRVDASPVIVGRAGDAGVAGAAGKAGEASEAGGLLAIVGDSAGRLVALDVASGEPQWEFDAGSGFASSPAVADGCVICASEDGTVWCFGG
jgi:outer membrane protein assembly factor BamB